MSAEGDLFGALSTHPGTTAIVGQRIYPEPRPAETGVLPAIVFQRSGTEPVMSIHGTVLGQRARMQVACLATTRTDCDTLAATVIPALVAAGFFYVDRTSAYEPEAEIHISAIEVLGVE